MQLVSKHAKVLNNVQESCQEYQYADKVIFERLYLEDTSKFRLDREYQWVLGRYLALDREAI